jgi:hypothetical protein
MYDSETVTFTMPKNCMVPKSQVEDYKFRGDDFEDMNILQFILDTYERKISYVKSLVHHYPMTQTTEYESDEENIIEHSNEIFKTRNGRPSHDKSTYQIGHPCHGKLYRVRRRLGHKNLLEIVGKYFPRSDIPETYNHYCACMLALLKPWRQLSDLKQSNDSWVQTFDIFKSNASERTLKILSNMQYYYDTKDAASKKSDEYNKQKTSPINLPKENESFIIESDNIEPDCKFNDFVPIWHKQKLNKLNK